MLTQAGDNAPFTVRPVQAGDAPLLHRQCLSDRPLSEAMALVDRALRVAQTRRGVGMAAVWGIEVVGFGLLTLWPSAAEISDLVVAPAYRSRGVGTALIEHLTEAARAMHADRIEISVMKANARALALYRRLGFVDERALEVGIEDAADTIFYLSKALR